MDGDHRLLLKSALPLLHSRNPAVILAVAQLYHYTAPHNEVGAVIRPLIRCLHSHREIEYSILSCLASLAEKRKGLIEPYLKSFFVRDSDPRYIRTLKLEVGFLPSHLSLKRPKKRERYLTPASLLHLSNFRP